MSMVKEKLSLRELAAHIVVTDYSDYRSYLSALYQAAKSQSSSYSYAQLSLELGLSSTNAFSVIQGKRDLSEKTATRISERLQHSALQKRYFLALIHQEHAKTSIEREEAFQELIEIKQRQLPNDTDRRQLAFFKHWYHAAILELLGLEHASDLPEWIAENIRPSVSVPKVKQSLELLQELKYLAFSQEKDRLIPTEVTISTGNEVERLAIFSYHRQMLDLAVQAMDTIPSEERDISAITIRVDSQLREQMKEELIALRKRFIALANENKNAEEILQVNFQLFPLSSKKGPQ